jgi:hypothetical protein
MLFDMVVMGGRKLSQLMAAMLEDCVSMGSRRAPSSLLVSLPPSEGVVSVFVQSWSQQP